MKYAYKMANTLNKTVVRNKIVVPYTNWDMRIDVYTGKKTIQKDLEGNPKKISSRPVEIYGYYLVNKMPDIKPLFFIETDLTLSRDKLVEDYYNLRKDIYSYEMTQRIIDDNIKSAFAFIINPIGLIFINLNSIQYHTKNNKYYENIPEETLIIKSISHEIIHHILYKYIGSEANNKFDNISDMLKPLDEYLGGIFFLWWDLRARHSHAIEADHARY